MNERRGFTLIELLTVTAIIAILASLVLLSIGRVRESAQRSTCLANLRQIQAANMLHAAENKGYYVQIKKNDVWWNVQDDFLRYLDAHRQGYNVDKSFVDSMKCPTALNGLIANTTNAWEKENFPGYGYNSAGVSAQSGGNFSRLNQNNVSNPSKVVAFSDALDFYFYKTPTAGYQWDNERKISTTMSYRHRNGRCVAYFDGHAAYLPAP